MIRKMEKKENKKKKERKEIKNENKKLKKILNFHTIGFVNLQKRNLQTTEKTLKSNYQMDYMPVKS